MIGLALGVWVEYIMQEGNNSNLTTYRPAIVMAFGDDGVVELIVFLTESDFSDSRLFMRKRQVSYSETPKYATWHWPPKVSP